MFEQSNLCALHAKRVTGETQKIYGRNGMIWKQNGTAVKIIFSHAERFKSCKTTTRNEYLKSIFCLYSTHSIYPEIKFQIHFFVSLFDITMHIIDTFIWHYSIDNTVLYTLIVTRVSPWRPIFVCWCGFISHENKFYTKCKFLTKHKNGKSVSTRNSNRKSNLFGRFG